MKSILGIVKDNGLVSELVYGANLQPTNYQHFLIINLVLYIANFEKIEKVEFILLNNFNKMSKEAAEKFLDKYDLVVQYSNQNENSIEYISKNKKKFLFIESPLIFRSLNKPLISQKYLRVMTGDHLGINFIEKYNRDFIRENFEFSFFSKKNKKGKSILLINQMVNDSAIRPINPYNWAINTIKKIREFTNDEIIFRDHPLQKDMYRLENEKILNIQNVNLSSNINIENDLHNSRCCVTFSSGSAIESLFLNIPVIAMDKRSFVYEIVENKIDMIEHLSVPNLKNLKSAISFTHYSIPEILDGTCWNNIKKFI